MEECGIIWNQDCRSVLMNSHTKLLSLQWEILPSDKWGCQGITTCSSHRAFQAIGTNHSSTETYLLVQICQWHLHGMAPHSKEETENFQRHLNSIHSNMRLIMETKDCKSLLFLNLLVKEKIWWLTQANLWLFPVKYHSTRPPYTSGGWTTGPLVATF
jgi:hypothetical protein